METEMERETEFSPSDLSGLSLSYYTQLLEAGFAVKIIQKYKMEWIQDANVLHSHSSHTHEYDSLQ